MGDQMRPVTIHGAEENGTKGSRRGRRGVPERNTGAREDLQLGLSGRRGSVAVLCHSQLVRPRTGPRRALAEHELFALKYGIARKLPYFVRQTPKYARVERPVRDVKPFEPRDGRVRKHRWRADE